MGFFTEDVLYMYARNVCKLFPRILLTPESNIGASAHQVVSTALLNRLYADREKYVHGLTSSIMTGEMVMAVIWLKVKQV